MSDKRAPRHISASAASNIAIEARLLEASQRLRSILMANEIATWTWDIINDRVIADDNLARLFGMSAEDAAGTPIENYLAAIHPDDRARVVAAVARAMEESGGKFEADYRVVRKDGNTSWVTARGRVERDANGKASYFPGVVMDVTERKLAEQKTEALRLRLEQESRLFETTLSTITDFVYVFNRDGRFAYVNQALLDLWGLKLEDAVGKDFYSLKYPTELAARLQRQIQQVIDTKRGLTDETPYTSPTGAGGYYEYIFRPIFDRDGDVREVAGSTRDISERKRAEEQLRQSQDRLRVLAATLETQVLDRTTELEERNAEVLKQSEQLRELSVRLMEIQDEESRRIARELHDSAGQSIATLLMMLGRVARLVPATKPDLQALVEECRECAQDLNREIRTTSYLLHPPLLDEIGLRAALDWYGQGLRERASLDVAVEIEEGFERLSRELELTIFRIIQECLTNIHRHSGSKTARIRIARSAETLVIEVQDAGSGMAPERLAQIRGNGGGVGLRGMRERVRQFAGSLNIDSRAGSGTTISVRLPLDDSTQRQGDLP